MVRQTLTQVTRSLVAIIAVRRLTGRHIEHLAAAAATVETAMIAEADRRYRGGVADPCLSGELCCVEAPHSSALIRQTIDFRLRGPGPSRVRMSSLSELRK